ncbi:MAG TPA: VOC family protein [Ignavibacteria bacterium]|jgi:predicted 3-demethylubiquinone-9 3-methyltransferase (glyoxalase superfamily)
MQKITTCLWFDNQAEEAVNFYTTVFKNSKIGTTARYDEASSKAAGRPAGSVMTMTFELEGREFMALNGGPVFKFNESISLVVNCKDQEEVDYFWNKLTGDGGQESVCGWLKDKFGLSWQIVPAVLGELMKDPQKGKKVMAALLQMKKLDVKALEAAAEGK